MDTEGAFTAIAEIAVSLAGFSGLVAVFGFREISLGEALNRVYWLVCMCFVIVATVFMPYVVTEFTSNQEIVWGLPIGVIGVFLIFVVANFSLRRSHRSGWSFPKSTSVVLLFAAAIGAWLVLVSFGLLHKQSAGTLLFGQLWLLSHAGYMFLTTLLVVRTRVDG